MKYILIVATALFVITQSSCNKPDAASIVEGIYFYQPATNYTIYSYKIVADTIQLSNPISNFYDEPYPYVVLSKNNTQEVTFKQFVPNDTITFKTVKLFLDAGGTLLKGEFENGKRVDGKVLGYSFNYDIWDTTAKKVTRVLNVTIPKKD